MNVRRGSQFAASLLTLLLAMHAHAQTWQERFPDSGTPGTLSWHSMAYDKSRAVTVLVGGQQSSTWAWDGKQWSELTTTGGPNRRYGAAMAYDSARQKLVVYGGRSYGSGCPASLAETWEWDGTSWTKITPAATDAGLPGGRYGAGLAFDPARNRTVLFGGRSVTTSCGAIDKADTWEWDGTSWTPVVTANGPSSRHDTAMAYDPELGGVVLFGGFPGSGNPYDDAWVFDGGDWGQLPVTGPAARFQHGMVYDDARRALVLFGGLNSQLNSVADTWELSVDAGWTQITSGFPEQRSQLAMAYDSARKRVVLYGGALSQNPSYGDTWEYFDPDAGDEEIDAGTDAGLDAGVEEPDAGIVEGTGGGAGGGGDNGAAETKGCGCNAGPEFALGLLALGAFAMRARRR